ncbi:YuiB family protein [Aciduricibacillus chroicocephali]|uniref:YuiB family protein n=1 Tax=Aciduricibacillus chroicocephali TaxID=3054939 RepID=A0ABY9KSI9_9BACI|nr:YuiB family protein [Bacillaceae bacterium 44XB]
MIQLVVSIVLFFVIFFGIAFILNMLLRKTWLMAWFYPIIVLIIVDKMSTVQYFKQPGKAFKQAFDNLFSIAPVDVAILLSGFVGVVVSGFVIRLLRKSGYQMF